MTLRIKNMIAGTAPDIAVLARTGPYIWLEIAGPAFLA
jgi:hypothetical protein